MWLYLPILLRTRRSFLFPSLCSTASSSCGHRQPRGSRASRTSITTSDASITCNRRGEGLLKHDLISAFLLWISKRSQRVTLFNSEQRNFFELLSTAFCFSESFLTSTCENTPNKNEENHKSTNDGGFVDFSFYLPGFFGPGFWLFTWRLFSLFSLLGSLFFFSFFVLLFFFLDLLKKQMQLQSEILNPQNQTPVTGERSVEGDVRADLLPPLLCLSQDLFSEGSNAGNTWVLLHSFAHSFLFRLLPQFFVVFPNLIRCCKNLKQPLRVCSYQNYDTCDPVHAGLVQVLRTLFTFFWILYRFEHDIRLLAFFNSKKKRDEHSFILRVFNRQFSLKRYEIMAAQLKRMGGLNNRSLGF